MKLAGKTAVVSGGNGGIGSAIVSQLRKRGVTVYSLDVVSEKSQVIEGVHYLQADLTDSVQLRKALEEITSKVDILILSTGVMRRGTVFESSEDDFDLLFNANVKTAWLLLKHIKPMLVDDAMIAQISSGHALYPVPDPGLYTLTKKTTSALAEIVALTCPSFDVKLIYPGPVLTKLLLTERSDADRERISKIAMQPAKFAEKVMELLESDSKSLEFVDEDFSYILK